MFPVFALSATIKIQNSNQTVDSFLPHHPAELQIFRLALLLGRPPGRGFVLVLETVGVLSDFGCPP